MTPKLVGLASRHAGKPFHLIASHCQDTSSQEKVIDFLRDHGMSAAQANFTITKNGKHPDIRGKRTEAGVQLMPYYIIFDHTGKLVAHHMCGHYHEGDGWKMIDIVDSLLKQAPEIYLGPEPFDKTDQLARQVSAAKSLGPALKKIESRLATSADEKTRAELERLQALTRRYRDRQLTYIASLETLAPRQVLPALKALARAFKGTSLAPEVDDRLKEMSASKQLKASVAMEKNFRKIVKSYESVKPKKRTDALIDKTTEKLEKLIEDGDDLPFAETVQLWLRRN